MEPIIGSHETRIQTLMIRKEELLLVKSLTNDTQDIERVNHLLQDVDEMIRKYDQPTTMRRRDNRENEQ
jgi:hypothetical protein